MALEDTRNILITSILGTFNLLAGNNFDKENFLNYVKDFVGIFCKGIQ